jgi:hypothetical protein
MKYLYQIVAIVILLWSMCSPAFAEKQMMDVTVDGKVVKQIPCERIPLDCNGMQIRAEAHVDRTKNGDIWALVLGSKKIFKSTDKGKTWTSRTVDIIADDLMSGFTILNDDTFLIARTKPKLDWRAGRVAVYIFRSTDYGKTWEVVSIIPAAPYDNICEGGQSLSQLSDGTVLFPVIRWDTKDAIKAQLDGRRENIVFHSKDFGKTWEKYPTFEFVYEPHIIELQCGKLLGAFRHQRKFLSTDTKEGIEKLGGTYIPNPAKHVLKNVFVGDSFDKGKTWVNFRPIQDKDGNVLPIFGQCHGQLVQVPDGRVVVVHDHRYPYEKCENLARVSNDGGKTWQREVYHVSRGSGYPSSVALEDGTIVTVTGNTILKPQSGPVDGKHTAQVIRWKLPPRK